MPPPSRRRAVIVVVVVIIVIILVSAIVIGGVALLAKSKRRRSRRQLAARRSRLRRYGAFVAQDRVTAVRDHEPFIYVATGRLCEVLNVEGSRHGLFARDTLLRAPALGAALKPNLVVRVVIKSNVEKKRAASAVATSTNPGADPAVLTLCDGSDSECGSDGKCSHWDGDDTDAGYVCCPNGDELCDADSFCALQPDGNQCSCAGECANGCNSLGFCGASENTAGGNINVSGCNVILFKTPADFDEYNETAASTEEKENAILEWDERWLPSVVPPNASQAFQSAGMEVVAGSWDFEYSEGPDWGEALRDLIEIGTDLAIFILEAIWNEGKEYVLDAGLNFCAFGDTGGFSCTGAATWTISQPFNYASFLALLTTEPSGSGDTLGTAWVTQGHTYEFATRQVPQFNRLGVQKTVYLEDTTPIYEFEATQEATNLMTPYTVTNLVTWAVNVAFMSPYLPDSHVLELGLNPVLIDPLSWQSIQQEAPDSWSVDEIAASPGNDSPTSLAFPSGYSTSNTVVLFFGNTNLGLDQQSRWSAAYDGSGQTSCLTWQCANMPFVVLGTPASGFLIVPYAGEGDNSVWYTTPAETSTLGGGLVPGSNPSMTYTVTNMGTLAGSLAAIGSDLTGPCSVINLLGSPGVIISTSGQAPGSTCPATPPVSAATMNWDYSSNAWDPSGTFTVAGSEAGDGSNGGASLVNAETGASLSYNSFTGPQTWVTAPTLGQHSKVTKSQACTSTACETTALIPPSFSTITWHSDGGGILSVSFDGPPTVCTPATLLPSFSNTASAFPLADLNEGDTIQFAPTPTPIASTTFYWDSAAQAYAGYFTLVNGGGVVTQSLNYHTSDGTYVGVVVDEMAPNDSIVTAAQFNEGLTPLPAPGGYLVTTNGSDTYTLPSEGFATLSIDANNNITTDSPSQQVYAWSAATVPALSTFDTIVVNIGQPITFLLQRPSNLDDSPTGTTQGLDQYTVTAPADWTEGAMVGFFVTDGGNGTVTLPANYSGIDGAVVQETLLPDPTSFSYITIPANGDSLQFSNTPPIPSGNGPGTAAVPFPLPSLYWGDPLPASTGLAQYVYNYASTDVGDAYGNALGSWNSGSGVFTIGASGWTEGTKITGLYSKLVCNAGGSCAPEWYVDTDVVPIPDPNTFTNINFEQGGTITFT